jgi:hypothetical protein
MEHAWRRAYGFLTALIRTPFQQSSSTFHIGKTTSRLSMIMPDTDISLRTDTLVFAWTSVAVGIQKVFLLTSIRCRNKTMLSPPSLGLLLSLGAAVPWE